MFIRMDELARAGLGEDLPDTLDVPLIAVERYWDEWLRYRALGKRHLPRGGGFRDQPYVCLQVIMTLDGLFEKILQDVMSEADDESASLPEQ